jgi:hypothetical protein
MFKKKLASLEKLALLGSEELPRCSAFPTKHDAKFASSVEALM